MMEIGEAWQQFISRPDEETFAPFYEISKAAVWSVCLRVLCNHEDAMDAFQATYCRLIDAARVPMPDPCSDEVDRMTYRIAIREAQNLYKRRARRLGKEVAVEALPEISDGKPSANQHAAINQARERMETLIALLPQKYQLPLILHYFHDKTHLEIAEILGTTRVAISRSIARGLKMLNPLARRAGLGDALSVLGVVTVGGMLLQPPPVLAASYVFAKATGLLAAGLAGTAGLSAGSFLNLIIGWTAMNVKAVLVTSAMVIAAGVMVTYGLDSSRKAADTKQESRVEPSAFRTVQFPEDRSLGQLFLEPALPDFSDGSPSLGEARGQVKVPKERKLVLFVNPETIKDFSPLAKLNPNDLQGLMISSGEFPENIFPVIEKLSGIKKLWLQKSGGFYWGGDMLRPESKLTRLSPESIKHLGHLSQLEELILYCDLSDDDLKSLKPLKMMRRLTMSSVLLTGPGLGVIKDWPNFTTLNLAGRGLNDEALSYINGASALENLVLVCPGVGDKGLAQLTTLPKLRKIALPYAATDAGLAFLTRHKTIEQLYLAGTKISDAGFAQLKNFPNLKFIRIEDKNTLDGSGLKILREMPQLEEADITIKGITNESLANLQGLKPIKILDLSDSAVTDQGLSYLSHLPGLKELRLQRISITDAGLDYLKALSELSELTVAGTKITDQGLNLLVEVKNLKTLSLAETAVSLQGIADFEKRRPDCKIQDKQAMINKLTATLRKAS